MVSKRCVFDSSMPSALRQVTVVSDAVRDLVQQSRPCRVARVDQSKQRVPIASRFVILQYGTLCVYIGRVDLSVQGVCALGLTGVIRRVPSGKGKMKQAISSIDETGPSSIGGLVRKMGAIGTVLGLCAAVGVSSDAQAVPRPDLAGILDSAAPQDDNAVVPFASDGTASSADVSVDLPQPGASSVKVVAEGDDGLVRADIVLPDQFDTTAATELPDGTVAYADEARSGDQLAVQLLEDGSTRLQTVLADASSPTEYSYSLKGFVPIKGVDAQGEDAFAFLREGESGDFVPVAAAWAKDALGHPVATHYEVRGDALVQVVQPTQNSVFPVVADPAWVWMFGGYGAKLNRAETNRVTSYAAALGMCGTLAKRAPGTSVACGAYAAYMTAQASLANSDRPKRCLFLVVAPAPVIFRYKDGHCR